MKPIPTAEELLQNEDCVLNDSYRTDFILNKMIEFAKLHVEMALRVVVEQNEEILDKRFIVEAYPLTNIK